MFIRAFFRIHEKILPLLSLIIPLRNIHINPKIPLKLSLQNTFLKTNGSHKLRSTNIDIHIPIKLQINVIDYEIVLAEP